MAMNTNYLSMVEGKLPPGFRFHPQDDELVLDYLCKKAGGGGGSINNFYGFPTLVDVDLNRVEPWDLPVEACVGGKDWYFYSMRDRKYATGQRTNRATESGYWKATGKDRQVSRKGVPVGMRKTLVFYQGRAPKGKKSDWVMHEFRREGQGEMTKFFKEDWVLCRVFFKSRSMIAASNNRPTMENSYLTDTASTSLPPLVDTTFINFDQPQQRSMEGYQQVSCFSTLLQSAMPTSSNHVPMVEGENKAFNQFARFDGAIKRESPQNLGQGGIENYLMENGLSHLLNTC